MPLVQIGSDGSVVMVDVMEEHIANPSYAPKLLVNTIVTQAPKDALQNLARVVQKRPSLLWASIAEKGIDIEESSQVLAMIPSSEQYA